MSKKIPVYFDNAVIVSPVEPIAPGQGINRLKVGVFTKYGNRNGSYITDAVAEQLIASATKGDTPVIGFFDPESKSWASHTGPTLASSYGYVEGFDGWQPFEDTDGEMRYYAVFSVVLFTRYFDEANFVVGQNQSMELDINSIQGDWANINGIEYFVYTQADILGLCIIGDHEPCFSVSSFFEKKNDDYGTQYEKFSSLLADVKARVEEAEKNLEGGEHQMENELNPEVNTETTPEQENPVIQEFEAPAEQKAEPTSEEVVEPAEVPEEAPVDESEGQEQEPEEQPEEQPEEAAANVDFEAQLAEVQAQLNELTTNYENAQNRIAELEAQITSASETEAALRAEIATYEAERARVVEEQRNVLVERYENELDEESIAEIREHLNEYSLSDLESKLAIMYANKHMAGSANNDVVPLPEPVVDEFALFMQKYRKN